MDSTPWYLDWKLWSAAVAWLSFLMNITPWIKRRLKGKNLILTTYPSLSLSHRIGITNIQWHLRIENTGGRDLDISKVFLRIGEKGEINTPLITTYEKSQAEQTLFAGVRVKPGETWQAFFCFWEMDPDVSREMRNIENATRKELTPTPSTTTLFPNQPQMSTDLITKINNFFSRQFKLKPSEFPIEVRIHTNQAGEFKFSGFRFTLYESDIADLKSHTERYPSGDGITWHSNINNWIQVPVAKS
ncbi:hypothetical protein D3C77_157460 [compost metagenome]|jgi:hypothetical protein